MIHKLLKTFSDVRESYRQFSIFNKKVLKPGNCLFTLFSQIKDSKWLKLCKKSS